MNKLRCFLTGGHNVVRYATTDFDPRDNTTGILIVAKCTKCSARSEIFVPYKNVAHPVLQKALQH